MKTLLVILTLVLLLLMALESGIKDFAIWIFVAIAIWVVVFILEIPKPKSK